MNGKRIKQAGRMILSVGLALVFLPGPVGSEALFGSDRFIDPAVCGDCHSDIYQQWKNSTHNLAHKDPIYRQVAAYLLKDVADKDELAEAESCVKCHTPVGVLTGNPKKMSDNQNAVPDIAQQGVQCDFCHSAVDVKKMYNNGLVVSPGNGEIDPGIKRGPRDDAESAFHDSQYSQLHTESKICGTCHNVKHVVFMTDLETTYDEWVQGPYNNSDPSKRVTCQGCHMRQRPGVPSTGITGRPDNPGYASDFGPERSHVFTHNFVGANGFVSGLFGRKDKVEMAEERLQNAARITLDTTGIKEQRISITITNSGAGHDLPTGLTHARQMWLEITMTRPGADGTPVVCYVSGQPDRNGYLPDDAILYNTVFGDGNGKPVISIAKAREILKDKRIPPGQSVTETIVLPPKTKNEGATLSVKLCYRGFSQKVVDQVVGKGEMVLPITVMAALAKQL